MTDEKKKRPEEEEVSEAQLQDVSGGGLVIEDKRIRDISDGPRIKETEPIDKKLTDLSDETSIGPG